MLHVMTVHYRTPKWINTQLDFLSRNLRTPYRTYCSVEGFEVAEATGFDVVVPSYGPHAGKLNYLAAIACNEADEDDLLMFLDGDAFPIADPMKLVTEALTTTHLVAVRRDENMAGWDRQPHPCFAVTKVSTWNRIHGDWSAGHLWPVRGDLVVSDVGGNLLYLLESAGLEWTPILRSNTRNIHPLFFGVYGNVVYHHGAGFRAPRSRTDSSLNPFSGKNEFLRIIWAKRRDRQQRAMSESVFRQIRSDPLFYRELCGVDV